jgi:CheY-like chemotaxis protein
MFTKTRIQKCTFTDPFKALPHFNSAFKEEDYHNIVLSDIRMPGINGYEYVRKEKAIPK